jgi:hypothetical protein
MENEQQKKPLSDKDMPHDKQNRGSQQEKKAKEQQQVRNAETKNTDRTGENEVSEELDII